MFHQESLLIKLPCVLAMAMAKKVKFSMCLSSSSRRGHSRARRVKSQVRQILTLAVVKCDWMLMVNPYDFFLGGKLLWCGEQMLWCWRDSGLRYIKRPPDLSRMHIECWLNCDVNISPMNARQMMYINVAQEQTVHRLHYGNITAICMLEISTFRV